MAIFSIERLSFALLTALVLASTTIAFAAKGDFDRKSLWNWDEYRNLPFDVETVSTRDDKGYRVSEIYFTSEQTPNGPNRIFCAFARPINPSKPVPALVMIHGGGGHSDTPGALWAAQTFKCAVIHVDWSGEAIPGPLHSTKWRSGPTTPSTMTPTPRANLIFHIVLALHRALDFMSQQPEVDMSRIASFGGSWGGYLSLMLAGTDPRVSCVMSKFGAGGWKKSHSGLSKGIEQLPKDQKAQWFELFDAMSYAKQTKATVLMTTSANDHYFWLGGLMEHYQKLPGKKNLVIIPNGDHSTGGPPWTDAAWPWIRQYFEGKEMFPQVDPGSLRRRNNIYSWTARGPQPIKNASLFFSPGRLDWPARYWIEIPAHQQDNKWEAELPREFATMTGVAYATVFNEDGLPGSSVAVSSKGIDPFTHPVALWPGDNLWDKARGSDAWRTYIHEPLNIKSLPSGALVVGPGEGQTHFTALTNSVVLASARVNEFSGIRVTLTVEKEAGVLHLRLSRYTRSNREQTYTAEINYRPGTETFSLSWSSFIPSAGANPRLYPFDGLVIEGSRSDGSPITIESLELIKK